MDKPKSAPKPSIQLWSREKFAQKLEYAEIQILSILMIYFDILAWFLKVIIEREMLDKNDKSGSDVENSKSSSFLVRMIDSFTNFTLFYFVIEIVALLFAFQMSFFTHIGYCIDLITITACVYSDMNDGSHILRLLSFLRAWRLARFVSKTIDIESLAHGETKSELIQAATKVKNLNDRLQIAENKIKSEKDLKKQVEKMMLGYKDEVETLGEALQIAAREIAEISQKNENETHKKTTSLPKAIDIDGDKFFDNVGN